MPTNLRVYDGSTDPNDHISRLIGAANQGEWEMPVWCRMFQQTLDGPARGWFDRMPNGSINSWSDLREKFVERFSLRWRCSKDPTEVSKIVQKANESLSDFKERLTEEMGYIQGVPEVMQISAFMINSKCPELTRRFADQAKGDIGYGAPVTITISFSLKRQLEIALGSEKLNHLVKDVRQRKGNRGRQGGNGSTHGKIINMARLSRTHTKLVGFSREQLRPMEKIELEVVFKNEGLSRETMMKFTMVEVSSPYNIILGRTRIRELRAVSSTTHAMMKFPTPRGIATLVPRKDTIFECRQIEVRQASPEEPPKEKIKEKKESPTEDVMINPTFPDQKITIGTQFSQACRNQLIELLKNNNDVFAWQPPDMVGIPRRINQHALNVNPSITPIAQKRGTLGQEKSKVVMKEVDEWLRAGIIRPVRYPTWISNPVLVKKVDDTWIMCIDFKNLNSACRNDYYPLPEIDPKIEVVMGFPFKCFLDAYKGYHQIQMFEKDEEKTAFYTDQGTFYYTKMPFGLKNARATYQRLSRTEEDMIMDVMETFDNLKKINMKLNPKKCSFGVKEGKFLGYMVTSEGIRANPKKQRLVSISGVEDSNYGTANAGTPNLKETLYVYLAASREAVREVLMADRGGKQTPFWYVSRTLHEAEKTTPQASGKLAKYAVELGAYNIAYMPQNAIKGQVLADFLTEVPVGTGNVEVCSMANNTKVEAWTLFTDGASSLKEAGAGLVLIDPTGTEYTYAIRLNFASTNNEAEYEALLARLRIAGKMKVPLLKVKEVNAIVEEEGNNWMTPIIKCIEEGIWLEDKNKARTMRMKIGPYVMEEGILFKNSYLSSMLRCVGPLQANYIIREIHGGACGMHAGARSVVEKIMRQGYYWPSMYWNTKEVVDRCDSCQIHGPVLKLPKTKLTSIMSPFGLLRVIMTDNETQLVNDPFKSWCEKWKIKQMNTVVAHPQANDLIERASKSLMHGFKARLGRERVGWVDELPNILWAHRTMLKTSNIETPFSLTYGSEAVIPAKIGMPTYRTIQWNEALNKEEMRLNLDLIQERRETAAIREAKYKKKMKQYYNKRVHPVSFKVGDVVYRSNEASRVENQGKLGPN
nr:hypothetical protein [Tanacetum cinerariifolium]